MNSFGDKLNLLINVFKITKENIEDHIKNVQDRLKKQEHDKFYIKMNSSSSNNKNIYFSFKKETIRINSKDINWETNAYGLSVNNEEESSLIFPIF